MSTIPHLSSLQTLTFVDTGDDITEHSQPQQDYDYTDFTLPSQHDSSQSQHQYTNNTNFPSLTSTEYSNNTKTTTHTKDKVYNHKPPQIFISWLTLYL